MNNSLLEKIGQTSIIKILQHSLAPRWITFCVDLIISIISTTIVLLLLNEARYFTYNHLHTLFALLIIITYSLSNLITGAYKCIVRFAVIDDILKSFYCALLSSIILSIFNFVFSYFRQDHLIILNYIGIIFIGVITLSMMILVRLLVKIAYSKIVNYQSQRLRVIILGTDITSLSVATTLRNEVDGKYLPVALLSTNNNTKYREINSIPIENYDKNNISSIFSKYDCSTLIIARKDLTQFNEYFADDFINDNIQLLIITQTEEFQKNNFNNDQNISGQIKQVRIDDLLGRPEIVSDNKHLEKYIQDKVIMITGAAGSIGTEIVRQVAKMRAKSIILIDQAETPMHNLQLEIEDKFPHTKTHVCIADIRNFNRIDCLFKKYRPEYVFHAAAYKHVPMMENNPSEAILTNVLGTKILADLSIKYDIEKFVMISTDKAVNPTNIMGASKRLAEIYVQSLFYKNSNHTTKFVTTRFGNVLGSNGSVIPLFRQQIKNGGPVTITHKDIIRYFMTVQEACSLVLEAGSMGLGGEIFVFDMGNPIRIYDLAKRMISLAGLKIDEDIKIIETGLRPGEKLYEELLNIKEYTIETSNKKIMIAKVRRYDFDEIDYAINKIISLAENGNVHDMVYHIKQLIPEFISNNSKFETIDNEIYFNKQHFN